MQSGLDFFERCLLFVCFIFCRAHQFCSAEGCSLIGPDSSLQCSFSAIVRNCCNQSVQIWYLIYAYICLDVNQPLYQFLILSLNIQSKKSLSFMRVHIKKKKNINFYIYFFWLVAVVPTFRQQREPEHSRTYPSRVHQISFLIFSDDDQTKALSC